MAIEILMTQMKIGADAGIILALDAQVVVPPVVGAMMGTTAATTMMTSLPWVGEEELASDAVNGSLPETVAVAKRVSGGHGSSRSTSSSCGCPRSTPGAERTTVNGGRRFTRTSHPTVRS